MNVHSRYSFWLVQRLEQHWLYPNKLTGEYMGSTEFELGAVPKSRLRMSQHELVIVHTKIIYQGEARTVAFLGDFNDIEEKIASMQEWVANGMRGQESALFDVAFTGLIWNGEPAPEFFRTLVWWAIEEDTDLVWSFDPEWLNAFAKQFELEPVELGAL